MEVDCILRICRAMAETAGVCLWWYMCRVLAVVLGIVLEIAVIPALIGLSVSTMVKVIFRLG